MATAATTTKISIHLLYLVLLGKLTMATVAAAAVVGVAKW